MANHWVWAYDILQGILANVGKALCICVLTSVAAAMQIGMSV